MNAATGLLLGTGAGLGLLLILLGWQGSTLATLGTPDGPGMSHTRRTRHLLRSRREQILAAAGLAVGLAVALLSGWLLAIVLVPVLAVLLPRLLASPPSTPIDRLEALEEWARSLSGLLGHSALQTAIVATRTSTPEAIKTENEHLIARLLAHQSLDVALRAWAAEIDDETGDYLAAALIQANGSRESGLAGSLEAIASDVSREVQARRKLLTEQRREFTTSRLIGAVAAVVLGGYIAFSAMGHFYLTGVGQLVLIAVVAAFLASLAWLQRLGTADPGVRILTDPAVAASKESAL